MRLRDRLTGIIRKSLGKTKRPQEAFELGQNFENAIGSFRSAEAVIVTYSRALENEKNLSEATLKDISIVLSTQEGYELLHSTTSELIEENPRFLGAGAKINLDNRWKDYIIAYRALEKVYNQRMKGGRNE